MVRAILAAAILAQLAAGADVATPSAVCRSCHPKQARAWARSPMGRAAELPHDTTILKENPKLAFRQGPYSWTIERRGEASLYSVTDGKQTITTPVRWIFGHGAAGQTYLLQHEGNLYESRVSYYKDIAGLDLTMGAQVTRPDTLIEALGRLLSDGEARSCFGCHTLAPVRGRRVDLEALVPGVQCETCHASAPGHAAAALRGDRDATKHMSGTSTFSAEEMNQLCGSCHRTWDWVAANGPHNVLNVRFQPYRISKSKCYDSDDRRIRCAACHDPHEAVKQDPTAYDAACKSCHTGDERAKANARPCRAGGASGCTSCHMPKYELPQSHHRFSDHFIRVPGSAVYPN